VLGQTGSNKDIAMPVLDFVTINSTTGEVTISWEKSVTESVIGYGIQEEDTITGMSIEKIRIKDNISSYTFPYPKVLNGPVYFNIFAFDVSDNHSGLTDSHASIFAKYRYDTCKATVHVKWTPYVGWGKRLKGYILYPANEYGPLPKIAELNASTLEYPITNIKEDSSYCFLVVAIRDDGRTSFSNKICVTTEAPSKPAYIIGNYTRYSDADKLDLNFSVDPSSARDAYQLLRAEASSGNYIAIDTLKKSSDGTVSFTDDLPGNRIYKYKLQYLNRCYQGGMSSIPINNILLKGQTETTTNHLLWNSFETWKNGTDSIKVYRILSQGDPKELASLPPESIEYSDRIDPQDQLSGDICYQVKYVSNPDSLGKTNISASDVFCVNMLGTVFMPNAFTPNNDGQNDVFKPSFSVLPSKYTFTVYNRYGAKVFETNNVSEGWNGRLSNGSKALEGAYIYYLKIESGAGKVLEKRGNFSLIYP
jgi:gliding motility-associated-like protein